MGGSNKNTNTAQANGARALPAHVVADVQRLVPPVLGDRAVAALERREFVDVMYLMSSERHWEFLQRVAPYLDDAEGAACVRDWWTGEKTAVAPRDVLYWFRRFPSQRATVPRTLPPLVTIYRGVSAPTMAAALRRVRRPSWTLEHPIAAWFAARCWPCEDAATDARIIATARVDRSAILAHLTDRNEAEVIVDPAELGPITKTPLTSADAAIGRAWRTEQNINAEAVAS